ncbi:MAG: ADP-ribosylglycohydrolase family protein [Bacillota bacterium]
MIGAIAGDIIGSVYEHFSIKTAYFELFHQASRFTDDTVLTVAVADCIMHGKDYARILKEYTRRYPDAGYGENFFQWAFSEGEEPYYSFGNGSAMRVSPVGFAYSDLQTVLKEAEQSAAVTHNHPEGIKGAQAVAAVIHLAQNDYSKRKIKTYIVEQFGYNLERTIEQIRPNYQFDVTCQGSVPEAIIAFLEAENFEDAVRKAVSLGGDSDTIACMSGAMAQAYFGEVPYQIEEKTRSMLPYELLEVVDEFNRFAGLE